MESENKRQNILEIKDQIHKINQRLEHIKPWTDNLAQPRDDYELEYLNKLNSEKKELINQKQYLNFILKQLK
jgi:hypothetical protein